MRQDSCLIPCVRICKMAISVEQIDVWRQLRSETEVLEFKSAKTQFDTRTLFEYSVAIGNEGGGHLVLGISDQVPRVIVGTKAIDNPISMSEKIFEKLGFRVHIEIILHPEGRVVALIIPGRPRGSAFHLEGRYLMRVGQTVQPMSEDQLRKILVECTPVWIEGHATRNLSAARILELLDTRFFFERLEIPYPTNTRRVVERLLQEQLIDDDGGGVYSIRRIAAILLAKDLRSFSDLARKAPRVVVYNGSTKVADPVDTKIGRRGYAVGFEGLLKFVIKSVPHREVIKNGLRTNETVYGPRKFEEMDRGDKVRACYQHCALKFEFSQRMTNQSLRERFKLPEGKIHLVSQVISATIEDGLIKPDEKAGTSKKFARYVPHWV